MIYLNNAGAGTISNDVLDVIFEHYKLEQKIGTYNAVNVKK